jgi:hypothetical protein
MPEFTRVTESGLVVPENADDVATERIAKALSLTKDAMAKAGLVAGDGSLTVALYWQFHGLLSE